MNEVITNFKPPKCKSDAIRQSARGEECQLRLGCCNYNTETTVWAHLRFFGLAGISQKVRDFLGVYACSDCHDALDGRNKTSWGWDDVLLAFMRSLIILHDKGLITVKGEKRK